MKIGLRQRVRLYLLYVMVITFPVTMNYFSVYLIIEGSGKGIMTASFFFWTLFAGTSLVFGRAACGYICPLGAYQETKDRMAARPLVRVRYLKSVKFLFAVAWVGAIIAAVVAAGGYRGVNLLYNTESGVSIDSPQSWITFGSIVLVVLLPVFFLGKRGFCHYFCPWGVLNMAGTKVKEWLRIPSLHLRARKELCQQCRTCERNCPMSLPVTRMAQSGSMKNTECILCGTCADNCPQAVINYAWGRPTPG
ncbi:MAG: 4Fe-4S binding protein [Chloroflexota bacterium]